MKITHFDSLLLRLPLPRPLTKNERHDFVFLLVVMLDTDAGHRGLGHAYALTGGGRAMKAIADDDLAPLMIGEDPLDHERLGTKVARELNGIGRQGLVWQTYAAVDLALWDLKGRVAGLPVYKLLGGARESAPAFAGDCGWSSMTTDEIVAAGAAAMQQGLKGIKVQIGGDNPAADAGRLETIRDALGEEAWFAVDANQRYDYASAFAIGQVLEELSIDWFEDPLVYDDVAGYARLCQSLKVSIAAGECLANRAEYHSLLKADAIDLLQIDLTRAGGLTEWAKIATLAEAYHRPVCPHRMPEVAVHLACGLPHVRAVDWTPWFASAFVEMPVLKNGQLFPPPRPGLGLEIKPEAIAKYRVQV
jgi:L-alanine-DL-glutamate epimerase-like enolase superfamily enzyme